MTRSKEERAAFIEHLRTMADAAESGAVTPAQLAAASNIVAAYSLRNALLILSQIPNAVEVAGFHDWRKAGRTVRKGSKGAAVLVPLGRSKDSTTGEETGRMRFSWRYVFDVSQTDPVADSNTQST